MFVRTFIRWSCALFHGNQQKRTTISPSNYNKKRFEDSCFNGIAVSTTVDAGYGSFSYETPHFAELLNLTASLSSKTAISKCTSSRQYNVFPTFLP